MLRWFRREIITEDCYRLKNAKDPELIIDIGANIGVFSLRARELFPGARIVAFEPHPVTFSMLQENTAGKDIEVYNVALGPLGYVDFFMGWGKNSGSNQTRAAAIGIRSMPLLRLLGLVGASVTTKTFIKLDCEGAERFLMDDESTAEISKAGWVAMEYHANSGKGTEYPESAPPEVFRAWFDRMRNTMHVEYKMATRDRGNMWGAA
jgi:FkbM family methyltransferase